MAGTGYMPQKQAEQVAWADTFNTVVGAAAAQYGVPTTTMTQFATLNTALQAAWAAGTEPSTRTRLTVAAKNTALRNMKVAARGIVSIIQGTPTVTNEMKLAAGLTVRKVTPTPKPPPSQKPFIKIARVDGRTVTIELWQDKNHRGKPANVTAATIFTATGPTPPVGVEGWEFLASTGRTTIDIPFGPSASGDTVWITAFWANAKSESGPGATPVSVNLPAGGTVPGEELKAPATKAA